MKNLLIHGSKIGKATVIVDIIPKGNPEIRPGKKMVPKYITEHDTGNNGRGADAEAHNKYIHNQAKLPTKDTSHVGWHVTVDENYIYQHIPFDETAWHCGDGAKGPGNSSSIGIEICMHRDQKNRNQAEENAIALTAYLLKEFKLKPTNVHPHQHWSGKFCPQVILRRDGTFGKFRARIDAAYQLGGLHSAPSFETKPCRLQSGSYPTKAQAEAARLKLGNLGIASAKWSWVEETDNCKFRWFTGTYVSEAAANAAKERAISNKVASTIYVVTA